MFELILTFAQNDPRIRVVGMEGSRTNIHIPKDDFQDYDISFIVTEMASFKENDDWLAIFGSRLMMQKPEAMELYSPELGNWFSYLMLFKEGDKMDLTLIPLEELQDYLASDKLLEILLDKDQRIPHPIIASDKDYHVKKPSLQSFDDCCNEFWFVSTYVAKGLCRKEILFANHHLGTNLYEALFTMLSWKVGVETDFSLSIGKQGKFLEQYLPKVLWDRLLQTFNRNSIDHSWGALFLTSELFSEISQEVGQYLNYPYPNYAANIAPYLKKLFINNRELLQN